MPSRAKRDGKLPSSRRSPSSLLLMVSVAASGPVLKTVEPQQFSALLIPSSKLPGHWCKRGTISMKNPGEWQGSETGLRSRMCTLLLLATPETPPRKSPKISTAFPLLVSQPTTVQGFAFGLQKSRARSFWPCVISPDGLFWTLFSQLPFFTHVFFKDLSFWTLSILHVVR
jgi:hypothetical protein